MNIDYNQEGSDYLLQFFLSSESSKDEKDIFAKLFLRKSIEQFNININKQFFADSVETCISWLSKEDIINFDEKINFLYDALLSRATANHDGQISYENIDELRHNEEFVNNIIDIIKIDEI